MSYLFNLLLPVHGLTRGIVFLRQVWCDLWHAESRRIRDWCDLPMLDLDLNGDDPIPRNKTRLEAFMEVVR